jgi:hypothetical protein
MKRLCLSLVLVMLVLVAVPNPTLAYQSAAGATAAPAARPSSATAAAPATVTIANNFKVALQEVTFNTNGTSTWRYHIEEISGTLNLSAWTLQLPACATVSAATPAGWTAPTDSGAGFTGIKWPTAPGFQSGDFTVTLSGPVVLGSSGVAATSTTTTGTKIAGPVCASPPSPLTITLSNGYRITLLASASTPMAPPPGATAWKSWPAPRI